MSDDPGARGHYNGTAADLRMAMRLPYLGEHGLQLAYDAGLSRARFAAFLDGDGFDAAQSPEPVSIPAYDRADAPQAPQQPSTANALSTCKLAAAAGMSRRGALKVIQRGWRRQLPGFYCEARGERSRWSAELEAFNSLRATSSQ